MLRTLSTSKMKRFCENGWRLKAILYFYQMLHLRCMKNSEYVYDIDVNYLPINEQCSPSYRSQSISIFLVSIWWGTLIVNGLRKCEQMQKICQRMDVVLVPLSQVWTNYRGTFKTESNFYDLSYCEIVNNKNPAGNYMSKVNNWSIRRCKICSKLTRKTPERRHRHCYC